MQQSGVLPALECRRRRPRPILRAGDEVCPQGVPLDVTQDGPQVFVFFDGKRLETSLPDVPGRMVVAMVLPHVRGHQPLHPLAQVAIAVGPEHQVKMVGHQAPGKHPHRQPLARFHHQIEKRDIVLFLMKHVLPRVAAIEHMVARATGRCSCCSCHGPILSALLTHTRGKAKPPPHRNRGTGTEPALFPSS